MEGIKDVSFRDEDMMLFFFNFVKEVRRFINYILDLINFFKIMVCLVINCYFVKKKFNLFLF